MLQQSPLGKNIVVFDLEIKNVIDGQNITWADHAKMGISVGVAYFFKTDEFKVYLDDNVKELAEELNNADIVSGFNIVHFDLPLLKATTGIKSPEPSQVYDLLVESRVAGTIDKFSKGMRLDDHLSGTFGQMFKKTEDGAQAPIMFQNGHHGRLISYCIADVKREMMLFDHVYRGNAIRTLNHGWRRLRDPNFPSVG